MTQHEREPAKRPIAARIQGLARKALDQEYECQARGKADHARREILAVLAKVGPVSAAFAADAHLAIRQMIRDDLDDFGFANEAAVALLYEIYAWCDEEAGLWFREGQWINRDQRLSCGVA